MLKMLLYILLINSLLFSAPVSNQIALTIAKNTFSKYHESKDVNNFDLKNIDVIKSGDESIIHIYQLNPTGFIMVSLEDKSVPVLAYGFESNFKLENMPTNLTYIMNLYKSEINQLRLSNTERSSDAEEQWNDMLSNQDDNGTSTRDVSPLLDAEFDQSGAWNNALTDFGFYGPVGCVAVSMSQIMHYWGYPEQGVGSNSYFENDYGMLEVDFGTAFYDFDNMAATYATSASQQLLYHTGISVNMDYDNSGSGASVEGVYPSAEYALENFFIYNENIYPVYKENYTTTEFRNILKNELEENRPILYSGYEDSNYNGGHAWNVDGYQGTNLHCNWGWGGWNNGYFNLTTMGGFDSYQTALIDIIPEPYTNPLALFEFEISDMTVIFIDLSDVVNETQIESWNWNYGDGNTETNNYGFAEHTYSNSGDYEVSLTVTNIYGQTSQAHTELIAIGDPILPGDVTLDEVVNILDVVLLINFVLGADTPNNSEFNAGDYNNDGYLNVQDIVLIINLILD